MNFSTFKQKALPHVIAILVFVVLTIFFYSPLFFEGKVLNQNDINQGFAASSEIIKYREATGEEALWTNRMFGGMPAYLISLRWSGSDILTYIEKGLSLGFPGSARETFLCLVCFYILLITFGVRPYLAIAGAIAYGFSSYFIVSIEAGHIWKLRAIAFAPLVIAGVHLTYLRKYWVGFSITALAMALELNSNHVQISYYLALMLLIYAVIQFIYAIKEKDFKPFLIASMIVVGGVLLGTGANLGKLWSTYEYGKYSIRGKPELSSNTQSTGGLDRDYAFQWSSGKAESLTLLIPNFYGGASGNYSGSNSELEKVLLQNNVPANQVSQYTRALLGYWGPQPFTSGPVYGGAVICLLFVLGILYADKKYMWWLVIATALSIMLSWGKHFAALNYFLFDYFPLYSKFRAVSMTVVIALTAMPLLGFIGLEKMLQEKWDKHSQKKLLIAFGITGGLTLLLAMIAYVPAIEMDQLPEWVQRATDASRKSIIRKDAFRSLFFIVVTAASVFFFFRKKIGATALSFIIILLTLFDILTVDYRYINEENYIQQRRNNFFSETPADQLILQDKDINYRVLNLQNPFSEARTSVFHNSIGGYHGAKMRRYQDFISQPLENEINNLSQEGRITPENTPLLNMLNTKYLLAGLNADGVIRNPYHNGNAWFIQKLIQVNNADEEYAALQSLNTKTDAVMDVSKFKASEFSYDSSSSITLTSYAPNKLIYQSSSSTDGYVVFSEIYYQAGWAATIDGKETMIDRVNYILRGMSVPAGKHTIEFSFKPKSYYTGNKVMLASNILLLLSLVAGLVLTIKNNKSE